MSSSFVAAVGDTVNGVTNTLSSFWNSVVGFFWHSTPPSTAPTLTTSSTPHASFPIAPKNQVTATDTIHTSTSQPLLYPQTQADSQQDINQSVSLAPTTPFAPDTVTRAELGASLQLLSQQLTAQIAAIPRITGIIIPPAPSGGAGVTTVGALSSGSIASGFGPIDIGSNDLTAGLGTLSNLAVSATTTTGTLDVTNSTGPSATFAGDVGIGTTNPKYLLDVAGAAHFDTLVTNGQTIGGNFGVTGTASFATTTITGPLTLGNLSGLIYSSNGSLSSIATSSLGLTTSNIAEGTNLYYTNARATSAARAALLSLATGISYASTTGQFSLTNGYTIPLAASTTAWNNFYNTPSARITAGTGLSWSGNTLNGSFTSPGGASSTIQYNKNGSFGGSNNFVFNGTDVGIGTSSPSYPLDINSTSGGIFEVPAFNIGSNAYHNLVTEGIWGAGNDNGYL